MQKEDGKYLTLIIRELYGILKDGEELQQKGRWKTIGARRATLSLG